MRYIYFPHMIAVNKIIRTYVAKKLSSFERHELPCDLRAQG